MICDGYPLLQKIVYRPCVSATSQTMYVPVFMCVNFLNNRANNKYSVTSNERTLLWHGVLQGSEESCKVICTSSRCVLTCQITTLHLSPYKVLTPHNK